LELIFDFFGSVKRSQIKNIIMANVLEDSCSFQIGERMAL